MELHELVLEMKQLERRLMLYAVSTRDGAAVNGRR